MWKPTSRTDIIPFDGGLDITNSQLNLKPGAMIACQGFEIANSRGYSSCLGYERYDGHTKPSDAIFTRLTGVNSDLAVDDELTQGATTADVLAIVGTYVYVFVKTGVFVNGVATNGGVGTITITAQDTTTDTATDFKTYTLAAAEKARALIAAVPGSGPIRGVWSYKGVVYAFRDNAGATECLMYKSTATGWVLVVTPVLLPGGSYEFINHNFSGHAGTLTMFGCDGVNKGFKFDGTTLTQITTGMTTDKPNHLAAHHNHLFFSFANGSVQHSSITDPMTWTILTGASERSVGDDITGLLSVTGGVMMITCRDSLFVLYGTSSADWVMKKISDNYGAIEGTIQNTIAPMWLSDAGISIFPTSDSFGDFDTETVTYPVMKIVKNYKDMVSSSVTFRNKNQYRLCFTNGDILTMSFIGKQIRGFTLMSYPIPVRCISASVRSDSYLSGVDTDDHVFFGSDDGFVYQMDAGTSFDGVAMPIFFQLPPFYGKYPRNKKVFRTVELEVETESGEQVTLYLKPDFTLFDVARAEGITQNITTETSSGSWNINNWNEFFWSSEDSDQYYSTEIRATGCGLSLTIGANSATNEPFTIKTMIIRYGMRGEKR
jgi:hypothetical protein